jgi:hypothetical protein
MFSLTDFMDGSKGFFITIDLSLEIESEADVTKTCPGCESYDFNGPIHVNYHIYLSLSITTLILQISEFSSG